MCAQRKDGRITTEFVYMKIGRGILGRNEMTASYPGPVEVPWRHARCQGCGIPTVGAATVPQGGEETGPQVYLYVKLKGKKKHC
jgi:hypothetical protein